MIKYRKNTKLRIIRSTIFLLIIALIISSCSIILDIRLRNVVKNFAKSAVKTIMIDCCNRASKRVLEDLDITYDDLAVITRNSEGYATSVEIDSMSSNRIKSIISDEISSEVSKHSDVEFSVPLFAAFGLYFTNIKWPKLKYTVHITTTVASQYESNFLSAGINQVLHQILLNVILESDLAMLEDSTEQVTKTNFIIAQTVIVGAVPDAFTSVGHATDEVMEDIFDFGAQTTQ